MNLRLLSILMCLTLFKSFAQIPEKRSFGNYTIKSTEPTIAIKMHLDTVTRQWTISREKIVLQENLSIVFPLLERAIMVNMNMRAISLQPIFVSS